MLKLILCKYIGNKSVTLVVSKHAVIIYRYTAAFLTSVLKCIKCQINRLCNIGGFVFKYTENAAGDGR